MGPEKLSELKGTKISVDVEEALQDVLIVSYVYDSTCYQGALINSAKRFLPLGINIPKQEGTTNPDESEEQILQSAINHRFTYFQNTNATSTSKKKKGRGKNRLNVRLRPRRTLCVRCSSVCLRENVKNKAKKFVLPEISPQAVEKSPRPIWYSPMSDKSPHYARFGSYNNCKLAYVDEFDSESEMNRQRYSSRTKPYLNSKSLSPFLVPKLFRLDPVEISEAMRGKYSPKLVYGNPATKGDVAASPYAKRDQVYLNLENLDPKIYLTPKIVIKNIESELGALKKGEEVDKLDLALSVRLRDIKLNNSKFQKTKQSSSTNVASTSDMESKNSSSLKSKNTGENLVYANQYKEQVVINKKVNGVTKTCGETSNNDCEENESNIRKRIRGKRVNQITENILKKKEKGMEKSVVESIATVGVSSVDEKSYVAKAGRKKNEKSISALRKNNKGIIAASERSVEVEREEHVEKNINAPSNSFRRRRVDTYEREIVEVVGPKKVNSWVRETAENREEEDEGSKAVKKKVNGPSPSFRTNKVNQCVRETAEDCKLGRGEAIKRKVNGPSTSARQRKVVDYCLQETAEDSKVRRYEVAKSKENGPLTSVRQMKVNALEEEPAKNRRMVLRKKHNVGLMEDLWDENILEDNANSPETIPVFKITFKMDREKGCTSNDESVETTESSNQYNDHRGKAAKKVVPKKNKTETKTKIKLNSPVEIEKVKTKSSCEEKVKSNLGCYIVKFDCDSSGPSTSGRSLRKKKCAADASLNSGDTSSDDDVCSFANVQSHVAPPLDDMDDVDIPYVTSTGSIVHVGDIIWGKITGRPWWPAKVLALKVLITDGSARFAHISWFGSVGSTILSCTNTSHFLDSFELRYNSSRKSDQYNKAIEQATYEAKQLQAGKNTEFKYKY